MAKKMDEFLLKELEFDLTSSDLATRRHALISLSNMERCKAIFDIFQKLMSNDPHPEIQFLARKFYNSWKSSFEEKAEERPEVFQEGELVQQNVKESFVSKNRQIKLQVAQQIIERKEKKALPLVIEALEKEKDAFVISALVKAVGAVGDSSNLTLLQGFLKHEDSRIRANTVEALDMLDDDLVFPILVPMLQDPDNRVKGNTIKVLMNFDEEASKNLIIKLAKSSKEGRRASACYCLKIAARPWVEHVVLDMIKKEEVIELLKAECELLAEFGTEGSLAWLSRVLPTAGREKGLCYKFAFDRLREKHSVDDSRLEELQADLEKAEKSNAVPEVDEFEKSSWEMDAIKDLLPKKSQKRLQSLSKSRKKPNTPSKPKAATAKPGFTLPEGASYLIPAALGVLIFVVVGLFTLFGSSSGGRNAVKDDPVVAGKSVSLKCRVRFIDKRKSTMTLAHGHRYYLGRFPKGTDLSSFKVRDTVRITGTQTKDKHFDAIVIECTAVEAVPSE